MTRATITRRDTPGIDSDRQRADVAPADSSLTSGVAPDRETSWLWFVPAVGHECALVIGDSTRSHVRGLATRFDRVERISVASVQQLIHRDSSVDCIVANDLVAGWSGSGHSPFAAPRFVTLLSELRRLLRPGGCLFLCGQNACWYRALLRWRSTESPPPGRARPFLHVGAARRALARAGFSEARAYFVDDVIVVPASRRAALASERERLRHTVAPLRVFGAATGLYPLLYPEAFVLATK